MKSQQSLPVSALACGRLASAAQPSPQDTFSSMPVFPSMPKGSYQLTQGQLQLASGGYSNTNSWTQLAKPGNPFPSFSFAILGSAIVAPAPPMFSVPSFQI